MHNPVTVQERAGETDLSLDLGTSLSALEQRLQKLEETVVLLQDTEALEERMVARLTAAGAVVSADQVTARPEPRVVEARPQPVPEPSYLPPPLQVATSAWLVVEMWRDLTSMVGMFFDIHYHVGWLTRVVTLVLVPAMLTIDWWFPLTFIPIVGPMLGRAFELFLAFFLFKFLSREAKRYVDLTLRARNASRGA